MRRASSFMWSLFLTTLGVAVADQLSKWWIRSYPEGATIFQAGFIRIIHIHNTGSAFGFFQGQSLALAIVAIIGIALLLVYAFIIRRRYPYFDTRLTRIALGLILGGTIGNLIERIAHLIDPVRFGGITDFIDLGIWPAFNVSDSAIVVGVIIFACSLLFFARKH
jgi:signal peptidase II